MSDRESLRREMDRTLRPAGERPDGSTRMTRRVFLHKSAIYGASAAACGDARSTARRASKRRPRSCAKRPSPRSAS